MLKHFYRIFIIVINKNYKMIKILTVLIVLQL